MKFAVLSPVRSALSVRATPGLLSAAPLIVRILFAQFPALGFDVLATYYLQSVMQKKSATTIVHARSLVFGGLFLAALPPLDNSAIAATKCS